MIGPVAVVAGNGPSLARLLPGRILPTDSVIRVNSFWAEPRLWLGPRVDLAFLGGDPRVAPLVIRGLANHPAYDLRGWTADNARVRRAGLSRLSAPCVTVPDAPPALGRDIAALVGRHGKLPTTGVRAVLAARALGARTILLAGIDLYHGPRRYAYDPGPRMHALMAHDFARCGPAPARHARDLDRAILDRLAEDPGTRVLLAADAPALADLLDPAPDRGGPSMDAGPNPGPRDWPAFDGLVPAAGLVALRRLRGMQRAALRAVRRPP